MASAAEDYNRAIDLNYSVEYAFVYSGPDKKEINDAAAQFTRSEVVNTPARSARIISISQLRQLHNEYIDKATRIGTETLTIDPVQAYEQVGPYGRALVTNLPGSEIRRLYQQHGMSLFDRNVRLFLGARKGGVNAGIRDTLASVAERKNFWAYNNGMTFVCDSFELDADAGTVTLRNFSVVNGCQTTVSIAGASAAATKDVSVLARIISASREPVVDSIITFTNSQTPIRPWDISSQDKNQKRLKKELAKEPAPFFYDLRRGETGQLSKDERKRLTRDGKLQVISHDLVAQYLAALSGLPTVAYKDKAKLFSTYKETVFPEDLRVEHVILAWQAGQSAEDAVRKAISEANDRGDKDEVLILKRGGKLFVLAAMGIILAERNGTTYLNRLKRDVAGSKATRSRLEAYADIALVWYVQTMKDLVSAGSDLSQLVRSQDAVPRIRDRILAYWRVQSRSKAWVSDALPKL